jgi:Mn2+/Fe2+ NRAMP family transporter
MTVTSRVVFLAAICAFAMYGCTTAGTFQSQNVTNVELSETNFEILARNVSGRAYADFLLGISTSTGSVSSTLALVRVGGTPTLYNDAIMNLWDNFLRQY